MRFIIALGLLVCALAVFANTPTYQRITKNGHQIDILTIDPKAFTIVQVKASDNSKQTVKALVKQHHAYAGINGGFFADMPSNKARPAGALKIDNQWVAVPAHQKKQGAIGWDHDKQQPRIDRLVTSRESRPAIVLPLLDKTPGSIKAWQHFNYVVGGIPALIKDGKVLKDFRRESMLLSFSDKRHARTAVCVKQDGKWLWLVASHTKAQDRSKVTRIIEGLTLAELTAVLLKQGCVDAINLDGGGSSTLVMNNEVVNQPAGDFNPLTGVYEERPIYDAMLIIKKG